MMEEQFSYTDNNNSWGIDLIEVAHEPKGFCLLVDESFSPYAYSLLKLDKDFKLMWKQTFVYKTFTELTELPNGDILLSGERSIILVKADGSTYTQIQSIVGREVHAFLVDNRSLVFYGFDSNYKRFLSGYDLLFNKIWENNTRYNTRMTYNSKGNFFGINSRSDSIRQYNLDCSLVRDILINDMSGLTPTSIKVDNGDNFIVLGTTNYMGCCCNDDIGLFKISPTGLKLWGKQIGNANANDYSTSLIVKENFYGMCGAYGESNCLGQGSNGNYTNLYAAKFDTSGYLMKEYTLGGSTTTDGLSTIIESDGRYLVTGGRGDANLLAKAIVFKLKDF